MTLKRWLLTAMVLLLAACAGKSSIVGTWEEVPPPSSLPVGGIWVFFDDGTMSWGGLKGTYRWEDKSHIRVELGKIVTVYEVTIAGDEMTLRSSYGTEEAHLVRYKELDPAPASLAGVWVTDYLASMSQCFGGLGLADGIPWEVTFKDGTFSLRNTGSGGPQVSMQGTFSIEGKVLSLQATGERYMEALGLSDRKQIGGSSSCKIVTLTRYRMLLQDDRGAEVRLIRKQ